VIGYDLLNEPIAPYFDVERLNPKLEPLYQRITRAIRKVDPHHIIFLGGAQWNTNFKVFGPPFDGKLAYTFHRYWVDPGQAGIQEYLDFSRRYNVPLWMGESGENSNEWIHAFRSTLETNGIGWCFWPYKKMDSPRCIVSIPKPADWDAIVTYANLTNRSFAELRLHRVPPELAKKALAEYLDNMRLPRCVVNEDYLNALGLRKP
jgi:aryl-phospho-beta-D-glucosidase BglC (GH1 family)